jgi:spore coat protein A
MAFDVVGEATDTSNNEVPSSLFQHPAMALTDGPGVVKRRLEFRRQHGHWTVNGRTWEDVVRSRFREVFAKVPAGAVEVWELVNGSGGWFHPVHIHLIDFKILDRNGRPPFPYETGPKDTAYVGENETVRVIARFGPQRGRYMIHCHNLVHEDHDMMLQYEVGDGGFDPIEAARAESSATIPRVEDYERFPPDVP